LVIEPLAWRKPGANYTVLARIATVPGTFQAPLLPALLRRKCQRRTPRVQ